MEISEKFQNAAPVLFKIQEAPVFVNGEEVKHRKALVRADDGTVLSIVSDRYTPMENLEMLKIVDRIFDEAGIEYRVNQAFSIQGGARTSIELEFPRQTVAVDGSDITALRCLISNSYNLTSGVGILATALRLVCSNGLVLSHVERRMSVPHYSQVTNRTVAEMMAFLNSKTQQLGDFLKALSNHSFVNASAVEEIFFQKGLVAPRYVPRLLEAWADTGYSLSGYLVYQTLTQIATHDIRMNHFARTNVLASISKEAFSWLGQQEQQELAA